MKQCFLFFLVIVSAFVFAQEARVLRFPTTHGNQVIFTYAGDLYTVHIEGGIARKLTNHEGFEMFARFSPDGKYVAFTGQYDGNTEVYVMPSEGGVPKRLTYTPTLDRDDVSDRMGPNNIVMGWRDENTIVYRSRGREWNSFKGQLYIVSKDGGMSEQLPLPRGGFCSYSSDGQKIAYNQVFREFRTWKHYRGGQADDISIYDFITKKTINITEHPSQDIIPMWHKDKIYFLSDRDYRMNLFCYSLVENTTQKITNFDVFDVKFPSLGDRNIVMENGGYLYRYNLENESLHPIHVSIQEDGNRARTALVDVSSYITDFDISPDGKRAAFTARGEIFTVPAKNGNTYNLTNSSGVHERNVAWSPDGKWLAYISDASGEDEIYIMPQAGGKAIQITDKADTYKYTIVWSPDSKKILWNDKMQRLQFVDIDSKQVTTILCNTAWEISSFRWSFDSKWVVYERQEEVVRTILYLYSVEQAKSFPVTDGWYDSYMGTFSQDGQYLFFISMRNFSPTYGDLEWNHVYENTEKLYALALNPDVKSPFAPKNDEVSIKEEAKPAEEKKAPEDKSKDVKISIPGIQDRIIEIPVQPAHYMALESIENRIYYLRANEEGMNLFSFDLERSSETNHGECSGFAISHNHNKMLAVSNGSFCILDLPLAGQISGAGKLNLSGLKMKLNRQEEWQQIFQESWRQMRDFFYAPNMHGLDWKKVRDTYAPLVTAVQHRADLTYVIGEMIGEINVGHAYVGGGDYPKPQKIRLGLLGADIKQDTASKYYRIHKILLGQNWNKAVRSPLRDVGVNAHEGDYILAIDGQSTQDMPDIYASLVGKADKQVRLTLNSKPEQEGSWETILVPTEDEQNLMYYNWVQKNVARVNEATNNKIGYIHIPDMGVNGLNRFVEYFYPQMRKSGLIIDVRSNGGGNVSPMIIERLRRELCMIGIARNTSPSTNPGEMHHGPKVCLLDEFSASDGDIFPYRFRFYKMGKLIGKRSWGGVVGIRGSLPFVDGGYLNRPEFSRYDVEGKEWIMEGYGVDPDIVVINDPANEFQGHDEQLEVAIREILKDLTTQSTKLPPPPPYPDKSK